MVNKLPELLTEISKHRAIVARLETQAASLLDEQETQLREARHALGLNGGSPAAPAGAIVRRSVPIVDTRRVKVKVHGAGATGKPGKRRRGKVTDETRASVKKMVGEGKTGAEMAAALRVSLPTIQNIKKQLGLVKK